MLTRKNFKGSQDTIIFHIQNEKVGVNGEKMLNVIPIGPQSETVKNPDF